jgi:serine phosphatase RsbU (regulator of sigma subunit)/Tfp pilus assembly protein PilF
VFSAIPSALHAQSSLKDSLESEVYTTTNRHKKIMLMGDLWDEYLVSDEDKALDLAYKIIAISQSVEDEMYGYNLVGLSFRAKEESDSALYNFQIAFEMAQEHGDTAFMAKSANNIGSVYFDIGDFDEGLNFLKKSAEYAVASNDMEQATTTYTNLGGIYILLQDLDNATKYTTVGLELALKSGVKRDEASAYVNLGAIAFKRADYEAGKKWYFDAIRTYEVIHDYDGVSKSYKNLAFSFRTEGKNKIAEIYYLKSLEYADSVGSAMMYKSIYSGLAHNNEDMRKYSIALNYYKLYMDWSDSVAIQQNAEKIVEMQEKFNSEQTTKENEILVQQNKIKDLANKENKAKLAQSRTIIISSILGLLLVIGLAFVLYNRNRIKQKANRALQKQRDEIAEQKKEITDSITYAKRIQNSFLPPEKHFDPHFSEMFLFYEPKDIVAGDFYILEEVGDNIFFSVADCTGHGVPGAMVSIVCANAIRKVIHELDIYDPGEILNHTRDIVIQQFARKGHEVNDGMDISFCRLNKKSMELSWAGANNALILIRNGSKEIEEVRPDKQPIGGYVTTNPFTTHKLKLNNGDTIYMSSDGYPDQFGGPKGKKYKYKRFKELLLKNSQESLDKQKQLLSSEFWNWKEGIEQIDDVCVMGVKI